MKKTKRSDAVDVAVGARIRNLRLRNKLSQTSLGEQLGVTFQRVQKYENGTNRVSAARLAQLAQLFGVPVAAFYSEVAASDAKAPKQPKLVVASDTSIYRLVRAFQALKDKNLRAAILRVAEEMVTRQRRK